MTRSVENGDDDATRHDRQAGRQLAVFATLAGAFVTPMGLLVSESVTATILGVGMVALGVFARFRPVTAIRLAGGRFDEL